MNSLKKIYTLVFLEFFEFIENKTKPSQAI